MTVWQAAFYFTLYPYLFYHFFSLPIFREAVWSQIFRIGKWQQNIHMNAAMPVLLKMRNAKQGQRSRGHV